MKENHLEEYNLEDHDRWEDNNKAGSSGGKCKDGI
jgi:hypothetical protein